MLYNIHNLLWACPLVVLYNMSVASVRVVEFGIYNIQHNLCDVILANHATVTRNVVDFNSYIDSAHNTQISFIRTPQKHRNCRHY